MVGGIGEICWLSCGVQVVGVYVYWEDGGEGSVRSDENSSESTKGEVLRVLGMKRCSSSLSLVPIG